MSILPTNHWPGIEKRDKRKKLEPFRLPVLSSDIKCPHCVALSKIVHDGKCARRCNSQNRFWFAGRMSRALVASTCKSKGLVVQSWRPIANQPYQSIVRTGRSHVVDRHPRTNVTVGARASNRPLDTQERRARARLGVTSTDS